MTATITGTPLKECLTDVLAALAYGLCPPEDCPACRPGALCEPCTGAVAAVRIVNLAIFEVEDAPTDDMARMAYLRGALDLGGITPQQAIADLAAIRLGRRLEAIEAAEGAR